MNYPSGEVAHIGDAVLLGEEPGVVFFSIDTDEYDSKEDRLQWSYLGRGVMIKFKAYGLMHYIEPEPDLQFVHRRK